MKSDPRELIGKIDSLGYVIEEESGNSALSHDAVRKTSLT